MPWTLHRDQLDAYAIGASLLASGGGGRTSGFPMLRAGQASYPIRIHDVTDLPPDTPCIAIGHGGSTLLQSERLPGRRPFAAATQAVERWLGRPTGAVCLAEVGGANGLVGFGTTDELPLVDADLMGRALPQVSQFSLLVDRLPSLVVASETRGQGVLLCADLEPEDLDEVLRTAFLAGGGWSGMVLGGFTVGDLTQHAFCGTLHQALHLGQAWMASRGRPLAARAADIGATFLGSGRLTLSTDRNTDGVGSFSLRSGSGVVRVVFRDDFLAVLVDGAVAAATPDVVSVVELGTDVVLQTDDVVDGRHVAVLSLPQAPWWRDRPERVRSVELAAYGLGDLDPAGAVR